jgi:PIN domain nuclease of toxin-antitoxin system
MVLDTHIWIWWITGMPQASQEVLELIRLNRANLCISAMSLWEAHLLMEKKRLVVRGKPDRVIRKWLETYPLEVVPVSGEIALLGRTLPIEHGDPADRLILATAVSRKMPLITADEKLRSLEWSPTLPL